MATAKNVDTTTTTPKASPAALSNWVKLDGATDEEAIRFELPGKATVSDLLLTSFETLLQKDSRVVDFYLTLDDKQISNLNPLAPFDSSKIFVIKQKMKQPAPVPTGIRNGARPPDAATRTSARSKQHPVRSSDKATTSNPPSRAKSPGSSAVQRPSSRNAPRASSPGTHSQAAGREGAAADTASAACRFEPRWGLPTCAKCGRHKSNHIAFPPSAEQVQGEVLRRANKKLLDRSHVPSRTRHSERKNGEIYTPPNRRNEAVACKAFSPSWDHDELCQKCHQMRKEHGPAALSRLPSPTSSRRRSPPRIVVPCSTPRDLRGVCEYFAPLWNNNDYCCHCYHERGFHSKSALRIVTVRESKKSRVAQEQLLRVTALPWHFVFEFCPVEDLLKVAQVDRLFTQCVRPLLSATMKEVLVIDVVDEREKLRQNIIPVAENFFGHGEVSDLLVDLCTRLFNPLMQDKSMMSTYSFRLELLGHLCENIGADVLTKTDGEDITRISAMIPHAQRQAHSLHPLLQFLTALWLQNKIRVRAARYLAAEKITI